MKHSYIKKVKVENFRAVKEIEFEPGRKLTLITGKNGTAKSTVLGMIAHPFSFNPKILLGENYTKTSMALIEDKNTVADMEKEIENISRVQGQFFESLVSNHFKLSEIDVKGSRHAEIVLFDKSVNKDLVIEVESNNYEDRKVPRLVTRKKLPAPSPGEKDTRSSNKILPVIYLSLKRVFPIVEAKHQEIKLKITSDEEQYLKRLYDQILLNQYPDNLSGIDVRHKTSLSFLKEDMSIHMISSGEDNVGQILEALLSFKRLKKTYKNYSGGILLIDELDATLYPGAQIQLLNVLMEEARASNLQLFMTSHSMFLIEHALSLNGEDGIYPGDIEVLMLKKQNESVNVIKNVDRNTLWQDLHEEMISETKEEKIRVYFEDKEAEFFFNSIVRQKPFTSRIDKVDVSLVCDKYIELNKKKIPEFMYMSCIVLDGDQEEEKINGLKNFVMLPSSEYDPPEKMIYKYLLDSACNFWNDCEASYTREILLSNKYNRGVREIIDGVFLTDDGLSQVSGSPYYKKKEREVWKMWFKEEQKRWKKVKNNPFRHWARVNSDKVDTFKLDLIKSLNFIALKNGMPPFG